MDILLPDAALPIRFHECRPGYRGHAGSFETTLTGLSVRLDDDKGENLEATFPTSSPIGVSGERLTATIYAFKKGRGDAYRKNEGVIFTVNGQTHAHLTLDFFRRKAVGLSYLAESTLVVIDCTSLTGRAREDLFMNSRDRLSAAPLRHAIEDELEVLLKNHDGLRELKERRRREELEESLKDSKPLEEVLEKLIRQSPSLSQLFLLGDRATNPFKAKTVQTQEKKFEGKRYPTYFRFRGKDYSERLERECHINMRTRISFETDAVNDYFSRQVDPGSFAVNVAGPNSESLEVNDYSVNLQNGIATLNLKLPGNCTVGQTLEFVVIVTDSTQLEPFRNTFQLRVRPAVEPSGNKGQRRKPPSETEGEEREVPTGIQLPNWVRVGEPNWSKHEPPFDQFTALRIKHAGNSEEQSKNGSDVYDFFINEDNVHLKRYLKYDLKAGESDVLARTRFEIALMLTGLAVIYRASKPDHKNDGEIDNNESNVEEQVDHFTKAIAPFLLPMIDALGALEPEQVEAMDASGEAS
jgi:hypothetical protein